MATGHRRSPSDLADSIRGGLVENDFLLFKHEDEVGCCFLAIDSSDTARYLANDLLEDLECKSFDDFFSIFLDRYQYNDEIFKDLKDTTTNEHDEFRRFIEDSISNPRSLRSTFEDMNNSMKNTRRN